MLNHCAVLSLNLKTKLPFMKLRNVVIALVASVFIMSCSQDNDDLPAPAPTYPVQGLWVGTYSVDGQPSATNLPYSFAFSPDGTVVTGGKGDDGNIYYSEGTWIKTDSIVTATYTTINYGSYQVTQKATLTYHNDGTMTNGTWEDVENPAGHLEGTFANLKRIN